MSEPTVEEQVDMALILEGRIKERVKEILEPMVERVVVNVIGKELARQWSEQKQAMMMEISVALGKVMRLAEDENRKPLWDAKPEDFGFTKEELNTHMMGKQLELDE